MATQSTENVLLKGPEEWEAWNAQFKSKAISTNIWRLITPRAGQADADPEKKEPTPPNTTEYDKRLTRETRSQSGQSSGTVQAQQTPQEEVDYLNRPTTVAEMTTLAKQAFQMD